MHIGIDARTIFTGGGGDRTYFRNLIATMARLSPQDRWTLYAERDDPDRMSLVAPNVTVAPALSARIGALWNDMALRPQLRRDGIDLLHSQYTLPPLGWVSCPMVVTIHDVSFRLFPEWFPRRPNRVQNLLIPRAAHRAACVLTGSQCAAEDIARTLGVPPAKILVTPYGVEPRFAPASEMERQRVRAAYHLPPEYILGVGLLRLRKNAAVLLRAAALMQERGQWPSGMTLALTGNWNNESDAAAVAEEFPGLREIIQPLGFVADNDLPALYSGALCSVYSSRYEGFGLPPLESMACGCPTLSSRNSSLPEVIGDAGLLVDDYENPAAWAASLASLLADSALRADLAARGLVRAREFSWERTARETLDLYHKIARSTGSP
jgi:glycosyltransferase involved in cell wall biosynthesis